MSTSSAVQLEALPHEVLVQLMVFLPLDSLLAFRRLCRCLKKSCDSAEQAWQYHYASVWGGWASACRRSSQRRCSAFVQRAVCRPKHHAGRPAATEQLTIPAHADKIFHVRLDGQDGGWRAATCSGDKTVKVWNLKRGRPLATLTGFRGAVTSAWFPAAHLLASAAERELRVHDLTTLACLQTLTGHRDNVLGLDGHQNTLASASWDRTARVWDMRSCQCTTNLKVPAQATCVAMADERTLAVGGNFGLYLWDLAAPRTPLLTQQMPVIHAVYCDSEVLVAGGNNTDLFLYHRRQGRTSWLGTAPYTPRVLCLAVQPNAGIWFNGHDAPVVCVPFTQSEPPGFLPEDMARPPIRLLPASEPAGLVTGKAARLPPFANSVGVTPDLGYVVAGSENGLLWTWRYD